MLNHRHSSTFHSEINIVRERMDQFSYPSHPWLSYSSSIWAVYVRVMLNLNVLSNNVVNNKVGPNTLKISKVTESDWNKIPPCSLHVIFEYTNLMSACMVRCMFVKHCTRNVLGNCDPMPLRKKCKQPWLKIRNLLRLTYVDQPMVITKIE